MSEKRQSARRDALGLIGSVALGLLLLALFALSIAVLGLALPAGGALAADREDDRRTGEPFHWSGRAAAGTTLEITGIHGPIVAEPSRGDQVVVDATKRGRRSDPDEVKIEVREERGRIVVCARYPRPGGGLNDCGERQEVRNNDVSVSFRVRIPAGVHLVAGTVNGSIEATGLSGDVEATSVNGSVEIATSGVASATTVNGSVLARLGRGRLENDLEFVTVNGRIVLELPRDVDAEVRGQTVHGSIRTDFPLTVRGRSGNRRLSGTLGRGGHDLRLETVNGSIWLRAAGSGGSKEDDLRERHEEHEHEDEDGDDESEDEEDEDDWG